MDDWILRLIGIAGMVIGLTLWIMSDLKRSVRRRKARHRVDPAALVRISEGFAVLQSQMLALNKATRRAGEAMLAMRDALMRAIDEEDEPDCFCKPGAPAHKHNQGGYADI